MAVENPCRLIPMRVMACAIDPASILETVDDAEHQRIHKWSFAGPSYDAFDPKKSSPLANVWPNLFLDVNHGNVFKLDNAAKAWPPTIAEREKNTLSGSAVCVSWSPPAAWSQPEDAKDPNSLPILPDRWLVLRFARRIVPDAKTVETNPTVRSWIVDAGITRASNATLMQESSPAVVPVRLLGGQTALRPRQIGSVCDAETLPKEPRKEARQRLTVRGTEHSPDFTFASFVPANLGNLSMLDPLNDLPHPVSEYAFSYLVLGWYLKPDEDDPLARARTTGTAANFRRALGLDGAAPSSERSVLHGMIAYVDYFSSQSHHGPAFGSPQSKVAHGNSYVNSIAPIVGFGNTAEEAVARLLADVDSSKKANAQLATDTSRLLQALLLDQVWTWDVPGTLELEPRGLKASLFHALDGGRTWTIAAGKKDELGAMANGQPAAAPEKLEMTERQALHELNVKQATLETLRQEITSKSELLYAAFCQWRRESMQADETLSNALSAAIEELSRTLETLREQEKKDALEVDEWARVLSASLEKSSGGKRTLGTVDETPFQSPKEPAVAIAHIGGTMPKYRETLSARTVDEIAVRRKGESTRQTDPNWEKLVEHVASDKLLGAALMALAREGAVAEQTVADMVVFHSQGGPIDAVEKWKGRSAGVLRDAKNAGIPIEAAPFRGEQCISDLETESAKGTAKTIPLGQVLLVWTQQPWLPLFLDWEVEWWKNMPPDDRAPQAPRVFRGRTILADRPQKVARKRLDALTQEGAPVMGPRLLQALRDSRHRLEEVLDVDVLAQALSGLHQQLLKRDDGQPRIVPSASDSTFSSAAPFVEATSLAPPTAGDPNPLEIMRDGTIVVTKLRVVDRFGQAFSWTNPRLAVPNESLRDVTSAGKILKRGVAVERALLDAHRVAVRPQWATESQSFVRGFIVPSRLDKSLVVYDADAKPLGMIRVEAGQVHWRLLHAFPTDPVLSRFVARFVDTAGNGVPGSIERFQKTLDLLDRALARTHPSHAHGSASMASQLGRPLVLLRAAIAVERHGDPTVDPAHLVLDPGTGKVKAFDGTRQFRQTDVSVQVRIGSRFLPDDGVVGVYLDGRDELVETAKTAPDAALTVSVPIPSGGRDSSVFVDVLMDPRGRIHLVPDLLASTTFRLSPEWYEEGLRRLPAVVRVAPVLLNSGLDFARSWTNPPQIDLPIVAPAQTHGSSVPEVAASKTKAEAEVITARMSVKGWDLAVVPTPPLSTLNPGDVVAADGLVIVGTGALDAATLKGAI